MFRLAHESRDSSPIGALKEIVLDALRELGELTEAETQLRRAQQRQRHGVSGRQGGRSMRLRRLQDQGSQGLRGWRRRNAVKLAQQVAVHFAGLQAAA